MGLRSRRQILAAAAAGTSAAWAQGPKKRLLLPSDTPDEHHLRLMWYSPVPPIDPRTWKLQVTGLIDKPRAFTLEDLRKLPQQSQSSRMKCVQCWSARAVWGGFRYGELAELVKPTSKAKAVRIDCADKWFEYFTLEEMANQRVLFVLDLAGKPLPDDHGAPLRLIDPSKYGYKSAKLITAITFVEQGKGSMACDIGPYYTPDGRIQPGYDSPLDLGGKKREIGSGEITEY